MNVIYRSDKYPELQGKSFEIPSGTPLNKAAKVIEEQYEAQRAAEAAEQIQAVAREQQRREKRSKRDTDVAAILKRLTSLETQLNGLQSDHPDLAMLASTSASIAATIDAAHRLVNETTSINERLEVNLAANQEAQASAAELSSEAQRINKETMLVLKNNQEISNKAFNSYGDRLNKFRAELNDVESDVRLILDDINKSAETVRQAENITEEAVNIARQAAQEEIEAQNKAFTASINLMMAALGLDKATVMQALNAAEITQKPIITAQELAVAVNQYTKGVAITENAEQRIDVASAVSTDSTMKF